MNTVMVPSGGGDRTTFVGVIVPALVRGLPKALKGLDMTLFRQILTGKVMFTVDMPAAGQRGG